WMHSSSVPQSFAFHPQTGEIFVLQVESTNEYGSWKEHNSRGDLSLTHLSPDGSEILGHMYLRGFGHGVSMAVEADGNDVYIWTEVDAQPAGESARGNKLGRFRYEPGGILDSD